MNFSMKRLMVALVLAVVLALPLAQVPNAYSAESTAPEKALTFLKDVVRLDMTRYNAKLATYDSYPVDVGDYAIEKIRYTLTSAGSKLDVSCEFINNTLISCKLYGIGGSTALRTALYAQTPPTNMLDAAKGLIQRYQTYSGATYLQTMRDMLDTVAEMKPMTTTSGNVKLRIRNNGPYYTYVEWVYTANGIDVERKRVIFAFHDGYFERFGNGWDLYKVGTTEVKISREEAIRIAREYAYSHPYTFGGVPVNFTILDEPVSAELRMEPREGYTLYPWWNIQLYLDKAYPGMVGSIQVTLWADTGEVTHCEALSYGGPPAPTEPPTEPPPDDSTDKTGPDPRIIAVPIVLAIILGVMFYRKRKHRKRKH